MILSKSETQLLDCWRNMPEVANKLTLFIRVACVSILELFLAHIFINLFIISISEHKFNLTSANFVSVQFCLPLELVSYAILWQDTLSAALIATLLSTTVYKL